MDTMTPHRATEAQLRTENAELRARLEEAEDTLRAIRMGEADSLVVETENGPQLFSLDSAEAASNRLRGEILAQVTDAVGLIDNDERITYLNPALERLYRVQPGEMLGRKVSELFQRRWLKPGDEAAVNATLREHGEAICELIHITRDGRELHVQANVCLMRDAAGHVTGIITAIRDITERKLAEAQLHEGGERLRLAMDAAQMGSWAWEMTTDEVFWSPYHEILLGYEPGTPRRSYAEFRERVHPEDVERMEATLNEATGKRADYRCDFRVVWPDASVHWIAAFGRFQFDSEGRPVRLNGMVQEITALKQAEERLRTSEKQVRQIIDAMFTFVGMIAPDGTLIDANHAALAAAGLTPNDVLGRPFWDCYWWNYDPAVQDRLRAGFERAVRGEVVQYEETIRGMDDSRIIIDFMLQPVFDGGRLLFVIPSAQDITARKQAETALRASEERRSLALTAARMVAWELDPATDTMVLSANAADVFGLPPATTLTLGSDGFALVHPDDVDRLRATVASAVAECGSFLSRFRMIRPDSGDIIWVDDRGHGVRRPDGSVRLTGVILDVTARQKAEAALQASEEFNRTVLESSPDCIKVLDGKGRVEFVNQSGLCLMEIDGVGARPDQPWSECWPEAERPQVRAAVKQALRGEVARFIAPRPTAKGNPRWWDVIVAPIGPAGGEGGVGSLISVSRDVTAQKAAEADLHQRTTELRDSEARARLATEATAVGIWEWNLRTETLSWDAQMFRIYGIAPTTDGLVQYSDWSGAVLPEDLAESERVFERVFDDAVRRREFRIRRRDDGEVRNIDAVEALRMNQQGEAEWVVGTNLDVTERTNTDRRLRELASRLTEADQRKDEFLATLAHELRNPLAPITNALELLRLETGGAEVLTQAREIMERQIAHLIRLTDDLLDVGRIGGNKVQLRTAPLELASVIHHAVEAWQPHLKRSRHKFVLTVPSAPIHVHGDATRLAQVIGNLLTNASKYSDAGGSIWLTVQHESSDVKIIVRDTGIGIPPEMLDQIFHMFTQVHTSLGRSDGGLGIGLWLVKQLVELHGGTVTAHSDGLGHGTEFTVTLPVLIDHARAEAPVQIADAAPGNSGGRRILVVDDNVDNATMLALLLTQTGHEVTTAYDGLEAIATAQTFRPDVIFLDIGLPKLNGHDTCRAIRKQPWGKDILIFALTGWSQEEDRRKSADAGFDVHLVKPVDHAALQALLLNRNLRHGQTH